MRTPPRVRHAIARTVARGARVLFAAALLAIAACSEDPTAPLDRPRFAEVSAGAEHTCARTVDGAVWCWGRGDLAQLGNLTGEAPCSPEGCPEPIRGAGGFELAKVDAGGRHSCGLRAGTAYCWGFDWRGQLGDAYTVTQRCGTGSPLHCSIEPVPVAIGHRLVQVSAGDAHSCAVTDEGEAYCWGDARFDQLGFPVIGDSTAMPGRVAGAHDFVQISAGSSHTCAIDADAQTWCWGTDLEGRLGLDFVPSAPILTPAPVTGDKRNEDPARHDRLSWAIVDAGAAHTCGITTEGLVYCWGRGDGGRLGDGWGISWWFPVNVAMTPRAIDVSAGDTHSCAVTDWGAAYCWGVNGVGQVGDGTTQDRYAPTRVLIGEDVLSISAGARHTCAIARGDRLYCWGANDEGQLGTGDREPRALPTLIES